MVVVVVAAIVGSGFVILFVDTGTAAGASISLESAQSAGIDPFTRTVAIGEVADFPTHIAPITRTVTASLSTDTTTGGLTATGNAPGLYGGTGNNGVCDPHQLADYLTRTPAKAAAWAATLGITTKQIPAYVATLTPVVLTTDTRVTNHGYANGAATPRQSILQAGTAVLVDHYGIPRVKCGCGNPLTEPTSQPIPTTTGTPWTGYTPDQVTTITPAPRPQPDLTLTNITTGRTYTQPTGTRGTDQNGESSGTLVAFAQTVSQGEDPLEPFPFLTSHDGGSTWTPMAGVHPTSVGGIAYGRGVYVAVAGNQVLVERRGGPWSSVATLDLGAGEQGISPRLVDIAYGSGRFLAVGASEGSQSSGTVFTSSDGSTWKRGASIAPGSGATGIQPVSVAYGDGKWAILAEETGSSTSSKVILVSTDGTSWQRRPGYRFESLDFGGGQWVGFGPAPGFGSADYTHVQISLSRDLGSWGDTGATPLGSAPYSSALPDGHWYLATINGNDISPLLSTSTDGGVHWTSVPTTERRPLLALEAGP